MAKKSQNKMLKKESNLNTFQKKYAHYFTVERIIIGVIVLITFISLTGIGINSWLNRQVDIADVERVFGLTQGHREGVSYDAEGEPPAGGVHNPAWQNCGAYDTPIRDENAVHSLEHGAVWITYLPDLPENQVDQLRNITQRGSHRLLSPYPDQESPIVLTAWGYRLQVDDAEDGRINQFLRNYEQGPESPEPGARCSGGVGQPLE